MGVKCASHLQAFIATALSVQIIIMEVNQYTGSPKYQSAFTELNLFQYPHNSLILKIKAHLPQKKTYV